MPEFWLHSPPTSPPSRNNSRRVIKSGPLLNLVALQAAIQQGQLIEDDIWPATRKCERDLENYCWGFGDVLKMLLCLQSAHYHTSEWCELSNADWVPCDVYRLNYDSERQRTHPNALQVYLKFSIDDAGGLTLVLVSCHG
jgi:hypothetical protein